MSARLKVIEGALAGEQVALDGEEILIGSGDDCALRLEGLRERHARLRCHDGRWTVSALDGVPPIDVEGRGVAHLALEHGCRFRIGDMVLRFATDRAVIERTPMAGQRFRDGRQAIASLGSACDALRREVGRIVIGQDEVLRQVLVTLLTRGHCLLIGAPGLAKTLLVRVLAGVLDLDFRRVQFTPDLMPADVIGTDILEEDAAGRSRSFRFRRGPVFTNLLLADEINRTPPKTQAALLEAMQERRVTAGGIPYDLPRPFMVLATQNPIEQEGTYPLPEAQLDRFTLCIDVGYPGADAERDILLATTVDLDWEVERVLQGSTVEQLQHLVRRTPVSPHLATYATALIRASRPRDPSAPEWIHRWVRWGAGTRAGQYLLLAAKATALMEGRASVSSADLRRNAPAVLRHRIFTTFAAASENVDADRIVERLLAEVPEPDDV